ncbi:MAG: hypothetical protein NC453_15065 [Muribaculum sp.]|nr:hypothetical protein [Muribaculum sp.]
MKKVNIRGLYFKGVLPKMRTLEVDDELFVKLQNNPSREMFVELLNIDPKYEHLFRRFQVQYNGQIIFSTKGTEYPCDKQPWDEELELERSIAGDCNDMKAFRAVTKEQIANYRKELEIALRKIANDYPEMNYDDDFINSEVYDYTNDTTIKMLIANGDTPEEYADLITM